MQGALKEGVLRNHDGYGDEKVTSSYKFELFQLVFHVVSIWFMSYNMGEVCNNRIMYRFEAKREKERLICLSTLSSKPENWSFYVVVLTRTGEKCTKMRAARAAGSCFPLLTNNITALWRCRYRSRLRFLNSVKKADDDGYENAVK